MGSSRKPTAHRNSGTETAIESWRNLPRLTGGVSVRSDAFPVNHSNSIVPPTTTSSSSVVSAPVVFSSSQLPASVGTSDISHGCNSQVSLLTSNSATSYVSTSLPLYLLQEVPLSSHHLKLYQSMETSCHLSLDSQGRRTHPNQELF